jgi:hypothetical protein
MAGGSESVIVWLLASLCFGQSEEEAREAELFGGEEAQPEEADESDAREAEMFGGDSDSRDDAILDASAQSSAQEAEDSIRSALAEAEERLAIGGRLWLRTFVRVPENAAKTRDTSMEAPNLLELFADARPNDRVRAYVRGRLEHDWTVRAGDFDPLTQSEVMPTEVLLDQLWIKFDVAKRVYATLGQQRLKWGAGRFWNPTDFVNQAALDPLAVADLRTGVSLVKLHVPFEAAGANVYAIANLDEARHVGQIGAALRAEVLVGNTEITTSGALRKGQPWRVGADVSSGIGPFDVHIEGALRGGKQEPTYEGTFDLSTFTTPDEVDRDGELGPQVVAGLDLPIRYNDEDNLTVSVEGFYNDLGYEDAKLYDWLFLQGAYVPFYVGRTYLGGGLYLPGPGRWDDHSFTFSHLTNVSDGSHTDRLGYLSTVLTWLSLDAAVQLHHGKLGEFHYGTTIPAVPFVEGLEERQVIEAPLLTTSVGAAVRF